MDIVQNLKQIPKFERRCCETPLLDAILHVATAVTVSSLLFHIVILPSPISMDGVMIGQYWIK
jgi:ABC-type uncharacterized transport system YnjBCD permease subunit